MNAVQEEWEKMRIAYQIRYARMYKKVKDNEFNTDNHVALLEMSYVLIEVFGLTDKQVQEIERNDGLTNADLEAMLDITNLYAYRIEELAVGIVKAESYEDAREKVKAAYLKHNDCFDLERDFIELKEIAEDDSWFSDHPDVAEIDELV